MNTYSIKVFLVFFIFLSVNLSFLISTGIDDYYSYFNKVKKPVKNNHTYQKKLEKSRAVSTNTQSINVMSNIAYVDVASLCILHPISDFYYAQEKSFVKPYEGTTIKERELEFRKRLSDRKRKVAEAKRKIENLKVQILKEQKIKDLLRNKLDTKIRITRASMIDKLRKLPSSKRNKFRNQVEKKIKKMEDMVYKKYAEIDAKISKISSKYDQLVSIANTSFYAENDQKQQIVTKIFEDILSAIKTVSLRENCSQVFNSSFFGNRLYSLRNNRYDLILNKQYDYQMFKGIPSYALGLESNKKDYYLNKLNNQAMYIEPFWNSNFLRKIMILGGKDITVEVIKIIFNKYGKSLKDTNAAISAYNESKNKL